MTEPAGVVYVIGNLGVGGVVRVLLHFANNMTTARAAVAVRVAQGGLVRDLAAKVPLFRLDGGTLVSPTEREQAPAGGFRPPRGLRVASALAFWGEIRGLRRIVRRTGARVVSTFLMRGHLVALATRTLFDRRLRVVVNIHEHLSERAAEDYPHPVERRLMRWLVRHVLARADLVVVPANALREDLLTYGVPSDRIAVLANPVDLAGIARRSAEAVEPWAERRPDRRLLVGIGRLIPFKAYHVLVDAMAMLPDDIHAIVIGAGPELPALESQAGRLGVAHRVRFIGAQENPWRYLARADVFVHPSVSEAQGLVFVEAMSLGIPVVGTSGSAGIRESVPEGQGVLVAPGDAAALAGGIRQVLADPEATRLMVARGREAAARHEPAVAVSRYEAAVTG